MFWYTYLKVDLLKEDETININSIDYFLKNGILRQNTCYSPKQNQTKKTFGFKWEKRETYESKAMQDASRNWLIERYFGGDIKKLEEYIRPRMNILDAGCGSAYSALILFSKYLNDINYLGIDISSAIDVGKKIFAEQCLNGEFIQADLMHLPFEEPIFDLIFSEGVLHHTDSTKNAIKYLSTLLLPGGRFLFYVYKKKGPIREFADDYIRQYLASMNDQQAWDALIPLTKLGNTLGKLNITIDIPEQIPYLGIPAGKIDLQRFIYWYIFKAYFRPDFSIEEMNHINFDWYRPFNCHRHTPEQLKEWCADAGLTIERMNIQESGITIVARKSTQ